MTQIKEGRSKKKIWQIISIIFIVILLYFGFRENRQISQILIDAGPFTPIVAVIILILLAPTPITADPIVILLGGIYNPFIALIIGTIGNTFAMFIEYFFGAKLAEIFEYDKEKKKLPKFIQKFPADSWVFLIFGRMIPGYGSKIISLIAGAEKVNIRTYIWTSIVSGIFGAAILAFSGAEVLKLLNYFF